MSTSRTEFFRRLRAGAHITTEAPMLATTNHAPDALRSPFGELHAQAIANCPPTPDNAQRKNFTDGKPNVWSTLHRHLTALASVTSEEQYLAVVEASAVGMRALYRKVNPAPVLSLKDAHAQDEAAEGQEDVAQVFADQPDATLGDYHRAWQRAGDAIVAKVRYRDALAARIRSLVTRAAPRHA